MSHQTYKKSKPSKTEFFGKYTKGDATGKYSPPPGTLQVAYAFLHEAGCFMARLNTEESFAAAQRRTGNNICKTCDMWLDGGPACKVFQQYHSAAKAFLEWEANKTATDPTKPHNATEGPLKDMSVAAIASAYNLSKSTVRGLRGPDGKIHEDALLVASMAKAAKAITA